MEMKQSHKKAGMLLVAMAVACTVLPTTFSMSGAGTGVMEVQAVKKSTTHLLINAETLKKSPSAGASTVMKLPKNAKVISLQRVGSYSFVKVNGKQGYVKTSNLKILVSPYA